MTRDNALPITRSALDQAADVLRALIVAGCAAALILAGPPLPL